MRAALQRRYGPPDLLEVADIPQPAPAPDELLVRVRFSTVNRTDAGFLRAKPWVTRLFSGILRPRNPVLGCELAGDVVAIGATVTRFKPGDRVFGFDDSRWGGHAQFKVIREDAAIATIPPEVSYEHAAASTEGAHYALVYIRAAGVRPGWRVLVHGATGAIGSAAVQLLKHAGAFVVATSDTRNLDVVRSLGADRVVDREREDFTALDEPFDMVFDAVGKSSFGRCKRLLVPRGIYVSTELGPHGQNVWYGMVAPLMKAAGRKRILFPLPTATREMIDFLRERLERGELRPLIDRTYPLDDIKAAYEYVETGQKVGNVLIQIP